jgi:hypothetical protein
LKQICEPGRADFKAALKPPHSKRSAQFPDATPSRQRLECGDFSAAFPRVGKCPFNNKQSHEE